MIAIKDILEQNRSSFAPVVPFPLDREHVFRLDLSVANRELYDFDITSTEQLAAYIERKLRANAMETAVGGYGEDRLIYRKSKHFGSGPNARTIHLGIDVWSKAYTPLSAPLDATVHSFQVNDNFGDYGPTIILEHQLDGITFFTLYGHLSIRSLEALIKGKQIKKGEKFCETGDVHENGHWPPHLHFQVMTDMLGNSGDFPGVASRNDREKFFEICPDPASILRIET